MSTADDLLRYEKLLEYELAILGAQDRLLDFAKFTSPAKRFPNDPAKSEFMPARHLEILADLIESIERREIMKAIVNMPPRHGKTETGTKKANAWISGRKPEWDLLTATYGDSFARDFGLAVKSIIQSQRFRQVFPDYFLTKENPGELRNHLGKALFFLGRRSPTTGRGGDLILVDDPTKDDREVRYITYRDDVWEWFTQTLLTRRHHDQAPILVTQTRWHEDDIVGRITDPTNPKYSKEFGDGWTIVNLPAIAEEDDPMGRRPGEALWPERFGIKYLEELRAANPVAFSSLYQSDPAPAEGVFYQAEDLHTYERGELPEGMRFYGASDHAVSIDAQNDPTCMGIFGICPKGNAYIMPDLVWRRIQADEAVEQMIRLMRAHSPLWWYAERGHISRAIGPFLKKRMQEEGIFCPIAEDQPVADKMQRAHSARARAAQGRILFPAFAEWWPRAKNELLKFPNGRHDDFVDMLSIIGMKLQSHISGTAPVKSTAPKPGTFGELKAQWAAQDRGAAARKARAGW